MNQVQKRKLIRSLCHAAALTSFTVVMIGLPIAALILSEDELVKDSAREAINFSVTIYLWGAAAGVLWYTLIGIPVALLIWGILGLATIILPIMAIVSVCSESDKTYRYPFTLRLLKPPR